MNPHEGKVLLSHDGRTVTLQFTWGAIEAIRAQWGDDYAARMETALVKSNLPDVACIIATAAGMSVEDVMTWSPPIATTGIAINQAWQLAWFGGEKPAKKDDPANPPKALSMLEALSGLRFRLPFARASGGLSSGA
jgi:hypothetical protein